MCPSGARLRDSPPMTLLLGIAARWGAWQSSDHRLMWWPRGKLMTDASIKHFGLKARDGEAVLTYTGLGRASPLR
jgi:hypothetical protein